MRPFALRIWFAGMVLAGSALLPLAVAGDDPKPEPAPDPAALAASYKDKVRPLVEKYCVNCHKAPRPKGGLDLTKYEDADSVARDKNTWETVQGRLDAGDMPPHNKPQPSDEERQVLTAWIGARLEKFDCKLMKDPGRVTLRRLNRVEYRNTVRDLLGVDYEPAEDFPSDDVGYGFDNIGDVLTLSPILLEKYMAAAEAISRRAIVISEPDGPPLKHWEVEALDASAGGSPNDESTRVLASTGEIAIEHEFPKAGEYRLLVRAFAHQAGPERAKMALRLDGNEIRKADVTAIEASPGLYSARFKVEAGKHRLASAFLNDYYKPDDPEPRNRGDRNLIIDWFELRGPLDTTGDLPESHRRVFFRQPNNDDHRQAARELLEKLVTHAYRRPPRPEELDRLVKLVELVEAQGDPFERGIQLAVQAVLASPHFLYHVETDRRGGPRAGPMQPISDYELASRLSYFLWSTMPDEPLFELAKDRKLRDNLEGQVRRMLKDRRTQALIENFGDQWLTIRNLKTFNPDREQFPSFDEPLRAAMMRESQLFFGAIKDEDRNILEFIDADYTFVNERLAKHYGIEGVRGEKFKRVKLEGGRRGGLLTMASVLAVTSNPTRTSPVKRGKWILEQILDSPPPPPPPEVPELKDDKDVALSGSLRQRMEQHRAKADCATCHQRMDPLGFGFENFDAIGAWRDKDGTFPVDASGELPGGKTFNGPKELKAILKERKDDFARCLTKKLMTYAVGRGLEDYDKCAVDKIVESLAGDDHKFSKLVVEIVRSDPFLYRNPRGDRR